MTMQFDAAYYLASNADVAAAVEQGMLTAQMHWERFGAAEGRNPNAVFNTQEYLAANSDVTDAMVESGLNPLTHFLRFGAAEGRAPSAAYQTLAERFDNDAYLAANADVAAAVRAGDFTTGYQHWVQFGQFETARPAAPSPEDTQNPPGTTMSGDVTVAEAVAALEAGAMFADDAAFSDLIYGEDVTSVIPFAGNGGRAILDAAGETVLLKDDADISGLVLENVAGLFIEDAAGVTMTTSQYQSFTSLNAGQEGTPGHESVTFSNGGAIDLSGAAVPYNYVEEYRLSDAGNTVIGPDHGFLITGGAGDDTITGGVGNQTLIGNAGSDTFVFSNGQDGDDTILDFQASGALGAAKDLETEPDALQFAGSSDAAELAGDLREIRFVEKGDDNDEEEDEDENDGYSVDMTLVFSDGDSITLEELIVVDTDLGAFSARGRFISDTSGDGDTTINVGETITLTGVSGGDLDGMFGASLTYAG